MSIYVTKNYELYENEWKTCATVNMRQRIISTLENVRNHISDVFTFYFITKNFLPDKKKMCVRIKLIKLKMNDMFVTILLK